MDNHEELKIDKWVDQQIGELRSTDEWVPNSEEALGSLRQKQRQALRRRG